MMLKWAVLCCVVVVALGQEDAGCCTPKQWEGFAGVVTGSSGIFFRGKLFAEGIKLSYDYTNKKLAETVYFRVRNKTVSVGLIFDFAQKKAYRFFPNIKRCRTQSLKSSFKQFCIPDGARQLGNFYIGAGRTRLRATSYAFKLPKMRVGGEVTVTASGCIPIEEKYAGQRFTVKFFSTTNFANITPGIRSASVFRPPDYCQADTKIQYYEDAIDEELDMFVVKYMHNKLME